jgi:hypothetical protein
MSAKKVSVTINPEDLRPLIGSALGLVLNRHSLRYKENIKEIEKSATSGNRQDILESITKIYKTYDATKKELANLAELILELHPDSSADTEILEDSLNLQEDGLTIDSRSK